jgi:hypothetical protein
MKKPQVAVQSQHLIAAAAHAVLRGVAAHDIEKETNVERVEVGSWV